MRSWLRIDGLAILSFAALSALLWRIRLMAPATVDFDLLGNSDQLDYFYPLHHLAAQRLLEGELPLWTPLQLAGTPLLATPQLGAFYPPNLLHLLVPTERALELLVFGHLFVAGCLVYAFGRTLGTGAIAALIGAGVYAWSTFVVGTHFWPPIIAVLAWFALPLLGIVKIHRGDGLQGAAALGVGLAMPVLAGSVAHAIYGLQIALAYALWNWARTLVARRGRTALHELGWLSLGGVLGALLSAPQWIPTLELVQLATRNTGGLTAEQLEPFGSYPLASWAQLFIPTERGTGHVALVAILLVPVALIAGRHRAQAGFFLSVAVLTALIALGSATPMFELYLNLPGTNMFRGPARILCLFVLGVAILAALGADALLDRELSMPPRRNVALVTTLLLASMLLGSELGFSAFNVIGTSAALAACLFVPPNLAAYAAIALAALAAANLASMPANSEVQVWRKSALARYGVLQADYVRLASELGLGRVLLQRNLAYPVATAPRIVSLHGLHVFEDYEPLSVHRYADYAAFVQHGRLYQGQRERRPYAGSLELGPIRHPRLLAAAGVEVIARVENDAQGLPRLALEQVEGALPRAYVVHGVRASRGAADTLREIAEGRVDLRSEAVLESAPRSALAPPGAPEATEWVRIAHYSPEAIDLEVRMQRPGALVLLDLDFPGWRATANGKRARIYNANYLFRAILLPPGRHEVSFRYQPTSVRAGIVLGLLGLLLLAGLSASAVYLRRARGRK